MIKKIPKKIVIIGLGEIGDAILYEMYSISKKKNLNFEFYGVDINENRLKELQNKYKNVNFSKEAPKVGDYFILSVYTTEQVESVINSIERKNNPLIIIESTIFPETAEKLLKLHEKYNDFDLVIFPHRFNPGDKEHAVFNLKRIIGGIDDKSLDRALDFYYNFMPKNLIIKVPYFIAALSKVAENAYRFIEIAIAEEFKMECDRLGIDFNELRKAMNSKWNIDLKEARDGIGGKCLPKDVELLSSYFDKNEIIKTAIEVDRKYIEYAKNNKNIKNRMYKPCPVKGFDKKTNGYKKC